MEKNNFSTNFPIQLFDRYMFYGLIVTTRLVLYVYFETGRLKNIFDKIFLYLSV